MLSMCVNNIRVLNICEHEQDEGSGTNITVAGYRGHGRGTLLLLFIADTEVELCYCCLLRTRNFAIAVHCGHGRDTSTMSETLRGQGFYI